MAVAITAPVSMVESGGGLSSEKEAGVPEGTKYWGGICLEAVVQWGREEVLRGRERRVALGRRGTGSNPGQIKLGGHGEHPLDTEPNKPGPHPLHPPLVEVKEVGDK